MFFSELMGKIRCDSCKALRTVSNTRQLLKQLTDGEKLKVLSKLPGAFSPYLQLPYKAGANLKNKPTRQT